jgi:hypothetical protein
MSTDLAYWISTKQLLRTPTKYVDKLLYLGIDHTLVFEPGQKVEINILPFHLFSQLNILNHAKIDDIVYVIITVDSIEHFRDINDKFRSAGMTDSPVIMDDNGLINLINYHVTAILPKSREQFIQTIPY